MHVETFSREELLARLRETRLVGFDGARVYAHATLDLRRFDPEELTPAQRYVLMPGVRRILELRETLLEHDVDIFALDGGARTCTPGRGDPGAPADRRGARREPDGRDGLADQRRHPPRLRRAGEPGSPITVVTVDGRRQHPYYALRRRGWDGVVELEELPDSFQKKEYRVPGQLQGAVPRLQRGVPGRAGGAQEVNPAHLAR